MSNSCTKSALFNNYQQRQISVEIMNTSTEVVASPSSVSSSSLSSSSLTLNMIPEIASHIEPSSTLLIAETESWRQYVPLVVSVGVILDILLGSPIANIALGPMRRATAEKTESDDNFDEGATAKKKKFVKNPRERVDTDAVAQAALDKARYSMELRKFLEENKTEEQKYEEIRKKMDAEAAKFDEKMEKYD
jgi:hypothetical protein